jgi:hypothetical protein
MSHVLVRNVSETDITVITHLDGANRIHTVEGGGTHRFDARELDQVIRQGEIAQHNCVNHLDGDGSIPAKYALIPERAIV